MSVQGSYINFTPAMGFTGSTGEFFGFSYNTVGQPIGNIDQISTRTYYPSERTANVNAGLGEGMTSDDNYTPGDSIILGKANFVSNNNKSTLGTEVLVGLGNSMYNTSSSGSGGNVTFGRGNRITGQGNRNTTIGISNRFYSGSSTEANSTLGYGNYIGGLYNSVVGIANSFWSGNPQFGVIMGYANTQNSSNYSTTIGFANTNSGNSNSVAIGANSVITGNNSIAIGNTATVNSHNNTAVIGYNLTSVGEERTHMLQPNVRNLPPVVYNDDADYYAGVTGGTAGDFYIINGGGFNYLTVAGYN